MKPAVSFFIVTNFDSPHPATIKFWQQIFTMAAKEGPSPTVKFNVGGKIYEVSKSFTAKVSRHHSSEKGIDRGILSHLSGP
mmetsp:Transcript_33309/g.80574  ORF Transcript_33309/g.80574 Transcript_33309/m.80574 type:complete len:81 (+) Transcript_33309:1115-1357(+)